MTTRKPALDAKSVLEHVRTALKNEYHASLAMFREAVEKCPDDLWYSTEHRNAVWQIAYHTLHFTHMYLEPDFETFRPWRHHKSEAQYQRGFAGPPKPDSPLPLLPDPYTKEEVLEYLGECDAMVDRAVDALDLLSPDCGFEWYKESKLEHQIINIRHIQNHTAQIVDRLRTKLDIGVEWRP